MDDSPFAFSFGQAHPEEDAHDEPRRPGTARPSTASGNRGATAFGAAVHDRPLFKPYVVEEASIAEDDDDEESPFAFAPPPLSTSTTAAPGFPPPTLVPAPHEPDYDVEYDDEGDVFAFRPPEGAGPTSTPIDSRQTHPNLSDRSSMRGETAAYTFQDDGGTAGEPSTSLATLTPAASFARQVQGGAPDWIHDDGFTRDAVQPSTRVFSRRRVRQSTVERRKPQRQAEEDHGAAVKIRPHLIERSSRTDLKDTGSPQGAHAIPLQDLVQPLSASSLEDDKFDLAPSLEMTGGTRRRRTRNPKPSLEELEDSPYPAVQGSVSNIDDHKAVVMSIRTWAMGFFFCTVFSALNCFFSLRYPAPIVTPIITQLLSYPLGKFLAKVLPSSRWELPEWTQKYGAPEFLSFNPGPFSIKEHTILTIMANISTPPALGISYSLVAEKWYGQRQSAGFDIVFILASQIIGFGLAGLSRRFLVWPAAMIWPQNLVFSTVLNTLHAELDDEEPGMPRFRFFIYVIIGAFCWFWLPGFLFTALSAFSWICWMAPNNVVVNQLFGVSSGLGMGILTFDWSQISYVIPPLVIPWWAQLNVFCGFAITFWIVAPAIYYANVWDTSYLPMSTTAVFDRFGQQYNTSAILDSASKRLSESAYAEYSPIYLPAVLLTCYGAQFMLVTAVLVYTALYHGPDLWHRLVTPHTDTRDDDVHMRLMRKYREVPDWWYAALLVVAVGLAFVSVACFDTSMPPWALLVSFVFGFIYFIPTGIIFATTAFSVTLNMMIELVAGYIMPGAPLANVLFKIYAMQVNYLGLYYTQDLKLAHYQKIPPRVTFAAQLSATVLTVFVQVGVKRWLVSTVPDLCASDQHARLTCPYAETAYSASTVWGAIGPSRLFSPHRTYHPLLWCMLVGAVLPVLTWLLMRRYPRSWLVYVNVPVMLLAAMYMPPATGINYSAPLIVGFIFQYLIRHRNFEWWSKYNFLLSAGLDAGTVLSGILIFLSLQLPKSGNISLNWWGNEVYTNTADWAGTPFKTPPPQGFGPTSW